MKRLKVSETRHYDVFRWMYMDGWRARHCVRNENGAYTVSDLNHNAMEYSPDAPFSLECGVVHASEADAIQACELHLKVYPEPVPPRWVEVE